MFNKNVVKEFQNYLLTTSEQIKEINSLIDDYNKNVLPSEVIRGCWYRYVNVVFTLGQISGILQSDAIEISQDDPEFANFEYVLAEVNRTRTALLDLEEVIFNTVKRDLLLGIVDTVSGN